MSLLVVDVTLMGRKHQDTVLVHMISDTLPPLLLSGCLILIPCSISAISEVFHPQIL